jgi:hypothetical protein
VQTASVLIPSFPENREINREFAKFGLFRAIFGDTQREIAQRSEWFAQDSLFLSEQGIFLAEQGILQRSLDQRSLDRGVDSPEF